MKKTVSPIALLLVLVLSLSLFSPALASGFPIAGETVTLHIAVQQTGVQPDYSMIQMFQKYEEMTNVHIEWDMIPSEFLAERRNIIIASNELPDAFMRCNFPATDIENYAMQGLFVRLDDYLDSYMPNFKAVLAEHPDVDSGIRMSDGGIYSLPYVVSALSPSIGSKLFFNQTAMQATGQQMPTTTDELYEVLKALAGYDLNGNGKADEIPLSGSIDTVVNLLKGTWGLGTRGSVHSYVDMGPDGKVRFIPTTDAYKEVLQFVGKLYNEKLLDTDTFTLDFIKLGAKGEEGRVLSFVAINHSFMGQTYQNDYAGIPTALKGPYGDQLVSNGSSLSAIGAFVVTNQNEHVEETLRWVDYFYSPEGRQMFFMGEEGVSFEVTEDGTYQYLPIITSNPNGLSYEQALSLYVPWAGGCNPSVADDKYFKGAAMLPISQTAATALAPYVCERVWPQFTFSDSDNMIMSTLSVDIETYVKEMRAQFITGKKSFDEWDSYVKEFEKIGLSEYMDIYARTAVRYE